MTSAGRDARNRNRRRVRGEDAAFRGRRVDGPEQVELHLLALRGRLHHQVRPRDAPGQIRRRRDPPQRGLPLLGSHPPLRQDSIQIPGNRPQRPLKRPGLHVHQGYTVPTLGEYVGNPIAHRPCSDYGYLCHPRENTQTGKVQFFLMEST